MMTVAFNLRTGEILGQVVQPTTVTAGVFIRLLNRDGYVTVSRSSVRLEVVR